MKRLILQRHFLSISVIAAKAGIRKKNLDSPVKPGNDGRENQNVAVVLSSKGLTAFRAGWLGFAPDKFFAKFD